MTQMTFVGRWIKVLLTVLVVLMPLGCMQAQRPLHVVMLGDSNTFIGGDSCNQTRGWNKWFCDAVQPTTCRSYARSGATWTNTPQTVRNTEENIEVLGDNNVIYNQVCRLQEAVAAGEQAQPTLIIIMAGTNDAWFAAKRPLAYTQKGIEAFVTGDTFTSRPASEVLTLAESVRYSCELLRQSFPDARLVLITPMQATKVTVGAIRRTGDIIEQCALQLGAEVIRLDREGCVKRYEELKRRRYTVDGVHTNEAGARMIGEFVARYILL